MESKLGPYPWSSLGVLLVDSNSGMETQTMITLGDTDYTTQKDTIVHEVVHQWYGDLVTPNDWSDLWMNEGMAMYLQFVWQAETTGTPLERSSAGRRLRASVAAGQRSAGGVRPEDVRRDPGVLRPRADVGQRSGSRVGDEKFWPMVKAWPESDPDGTVSRDEYLPWIEEQTGADLQDLFDGWLLAKRSPKFS